MSESESTNEVKENGFWILKFFLYDDMTENFVAKVEIKFYTRFSIHRSVLKQS